MFPSLFRGLLRSRLAGCSGLPRRGLASRRLASGRLTGGRFSGGRLFRRRLSRRGSHVHSAPDVPFVLATIQRLATHTNLRAPVPIKAHIATMGVTTALGNKLQKILSSAGAPLSGESGLQTVHQERQFFRQSSEGMSIFFARISLTSCGLALPDVAFMT